MKKFLSARKKKAILSAVAAGICFSGGNVEAVEQVNIDWNGKTLFNVKYYGASDYTDARGNFFEYDGVLGLNYDLTGDIKTRLNEAFKWWAEILGPGANISQPAQYFVGTHNVANAFATSFSFRNGSMTQNPNLFNEIFQSGQNVTQFDSIDDIPLDMSTFKLYSNDDTAYGYIVIGQYIGLDEINDGGYGFVKPIYYASPTPVLRLGIDIGSVMFHEIGHSLGINSATTNYAFGFPGMSNNLSTFKDFDEKTFTAHLYDQNGTQAKPYAAILGSENDAAVYKQFIEVDPDPEGRLTPDNIFLVDSSQAAKNTGKLYLYFAGDNVTEVLDGRTFTRADGEQISGIPINLWENNRPDFAHIELERSMMSHQNYRSYVNFIEAELAVLQDIGYDIDRRNFYGRSIYNNGVTLTNYQGYSKRENGEYVDGYNNATLGVGLHVYGSNNNITQAGNIFANGEGAVGVRVDGVNNTITVAKGTEVHADGNYNDGVLIAYGKNHNVNIEGTVTATGESSNALSFDFGANSLGSDMEFRGSFMRYIRYGQNNKVILAENWGLNALNHSNDVWSFSDLENGDLNAPMVNTANISGKLIADPAKFGYAIYIDSSAFVDTININDGAEITGNIMSQWKHFSPYAGFYDYETPVESGEIDPRTNSNATLDGLKLQYNGGQYVYTKYIPDLVTKLNFNNTMAYSGNIDGFDNMKMNVNGNLVYGGAADVVSVNVASGAGLFGGTFTVNDMSAKLADGFSDDTTGKFFNHGTISGLTINGDLISDGTLSGDAGNITVNGAANVEGSTAAATNIFPDETMTILTANSITGNLKNSSMYAPISGLLSAKGTVDGNNILVATKVENNIGNLNSEQSQAFNSVNNMANTFRNDIRRAEILPLYNLDSENAGAALSQIGNYDAAQNISLIQQNSVANKVISDRLATAFSMDTVNFNVSPNNFADGDNGVVMGVNADYPASVDNNFWIKFTKNWGELKGGANYHGSAISGGYDRAFGANWRGGIFISYNTNNLGAKFSNGDIKDTRGGLYFGYHRDVDDAFIYIDGGKARNKFNRALPTLGLNTNANYDSKIFEIGGEYKRNLTPEKVFAISPFINLQYSHLKQDAYNETGAGVFNQYVNSESNNYFAGTLGVEFKRVLSKGNYAARIGVKHAFSGANPELNFSYEGDGNNFYTMRNNQNKTHFVLSLSGENEFAHGWILGGDLSWQKGSHDKDLSASVILRKVW